LWHVTNVMFYAGLGFLLLMTVLILVQVIARSIFDIGIPWANELSRYCDIALVFLAAPRLLLEGKHVAVDMLQERLSERVRRITAAGTWLLSLAFCAIVLWALYTLLIRVWQFATPALGIPNYIFYMPALLGFFFCALISIYRIFRPAPV